MRTQRLRTQRASVSSRGSCAQSAALITAVLIVTGAAPALARAHATGSQQVSRVIAAHGVQLIVPPGWARKAAASDGPVVDPRTLVVVGTAGVRPRMSNCQIAAYRIPPRGAVVVVVGWRSLKNSGAQHAKPGRAPLTKLTAVRKPSFECFNGRGAAADVVLRGTAYQVNVMVGDRASKALIGQALAVGRSFNLTHP